MCMQMYKVGLHKYTKENWILSYTRRKKVYAGVVENNQQ